VPHVRSSFFALIAALAACGGDASPFSPDGGEAEADAALGSLPDAGVDATTEDASLPPCPTAVCTRSERDEHGVCVDLPEPDGAACDDGDACTTADGCLAGVCRGTPVVQAGGVHGRVTSFGADPLQQHLEGIATFVSETRAVFLESSSMSSSQLSLVEVKKEGLVRLSEAESFLPFVYETSTFRYWGDDPVTYVLPMGRERFVVFSSDPWALRAGMELFDVSDDVLESRGQTVLPSLDFMQTMTAVGAAANEDALFACGQVGYELRLRAYVLEEMTSTFALVSDVPVLSGGCQELALSPDGTRLYVAANGGYRIYDVTDPAAPRHEQVVLFPDHFLTNIEVTEDHVAVLSAGIAGDLGDAFVFDRGGKLVGSVPPAMPNQRPFGIAVDGDRLYVQWLGGGSSIAVHDLTDPQRRAVGARRVHAGYPGTTVSPSVQGETVLTQPWRRAFHGDALDELTGVGQGSLRALVPAEEGMLLALGPSSRHVVDVADRDHPFLQRGGVTPGAAEDELELLGDRVITPTVTGWKGFVQQRARERFALLDASGARLGAGTVDGERDNAAFAYGEPGLFQVSLFGDALQVRRYVAEDLIGREGTPWPVQLVQLVPGVAMPGFPRGWIRSAASSPSGNELLVIALRSSSQTVAEFRAAVSWLAVDDHDVTVLASVGLDAADELKYAFDLRFAGSDAIAMGNDRISRLRREGAQITLAASRTLDNRFYRRILAIDGERVLVARFAWVGEGATRRQQHSVDSLRLADLSSEAVYETPDEPLTMTVVGSTYYVGTNSAMVVITPECSAPAE
jgi:hypothetical protein